MTLRNPHQDTPVLHNSNWGGIRTGGFLTGFLGVQRDFWEEYPKQLMFPMTHWVYTNHQKPHQDTPVLHNSNWIGIRIGRFLTGFQRVQRHFWEEYP